MPNFSLSSQTGTNINPLTGQPWDQAYQQQQQKNLGTFGNFAGGNDVFEYLKGLLKNGLPQDLQNDYRKNALGNIGGNLRSGTQALNEQLASQGNVPIGARVAGL